MNTLSTVIDKDQADASRPQQFRYLRKDAAIDWNTVGRYALEALPGAGIGLLLNRGILKNKSLRSNAIAALLGGTASTGLVEALRSIDADNAAAQKSQPGSVVTSYKQQNAIKKYVEQKAAELKAQTGRDLTDLERAQLADQASDSLKQMAPISGTSAGASIDAGRALYRALQHKNGSPGVFFNENPETMYAKQFANTGDLSFKSDLWQQRVDAYNARNTSSLDPKTVDEYIENLQQAERKYTDIASSRSRAADRLARKFAVDPKKQADLNFAEQLLRQSAAAEMTNANKIRPELNKFLSARDLYTNRAVANQYVRYSPFAGINSILRKAADPVPSAARTAARVFRGAYVAPSLLAGAATDAARAWINRKKVDPQLKAIYDASDNTPPQVHND